MVDANQIVRSPAGQVSSGTCLRPIVALRDGLVARLDRFAPAQRRLR